MAKIDFYIGIDEVGRGPIAGPVAVCAFFIRVKDKKKIDQQFRAIKDSKQLSEIEREKWFEKIVEAREAGLVRYQVSFCKETTVDREGIAPAVRRALSRALRALDPDPKRCLVLLDGGLKAPKEFIYQKTIIRGDETNRLIALASVTAKVRRDRRMIRFAKKYPEYGFDKHKGYGTKAHYKAIKKFGLCPLHRRSFLGGFKAVLN